MNETRQTTSMDAGSAVGRYGRERLTMQGLYAVLGATGEQGDAVVTALLERGAQVVAADLSDPETVVAAFAGVDGAYALTTPFEEGPAAEVAQGTTIIAAALAAKVPHLVYSSVAGCRPTPRHPAFRQQGDGRAGSRQFRPVRRDHPGRSRAVPRRPHRYRAGQPHATRYGGGDGWRTGPACATCDPAEIASTDMRAMFGFLARGGYTVNIPDVHARYPQIGWQSFTDWIDTDMAGVL